MLHRGSLTKFPRTWPHSTEFNDFGRVESWRRAGAAFELFDARIYLEL